MPDYGRAPTYSNLVDYHSTKGPLVARLVESLGIIPDPEQRLILDQVFAVRADGMPAASTVVIVAPRQNLKSATLRMIALGWMFVTREQSMVWTAHEVTTAMDSFTNPFRSGLADLVEDSPMLMRRVAAVPKANGAQAIRLKSRALLRFNARTTTGGRGLTADKTIMDEGFGLTAVHMGAVRPIMMARPRAQLIIASSACRERSTVLRDYVNRGRAGGEQRLAYVEWCDPRPGECGSDDCDHARTTPGCAMDDIDRLAACNPAYPHRVTADSLRDARMDMSPREFGIEIMGWHAELAAATSDLSVEDWQATVTDEAPSGRLVLAIDTAPSHAWSSIVVAGNGILELVDRRRGSSWLPERVAGLCRDHGIAEVWMDPAGPVAGLIPDLEAAGVQLRLLNGADAAAACGSLVDAIGEQRVKVRHADAFLSAVAGASRRKTGDRWKWSRASSEVDISPLVAATWACWGWLADQSIEYDVLASAY